MNSNPAKSYLKRYRSILKRADSIRRSIDEAHERAVSVSVSLSADKVSGSGAYDRMAEDVVRAADLCEKLYEQLNAARTALEEILEAIASVPDETQKAVLTMRYVEGKSWEQIQEAIAYEKTQAFVLHGRGLYHVNMWLKQRTKTEYGSW